MPNTKLVLRVEIDGRWSTLEMSESLSYLNDAYNLLFLINSLHAGSIDTTFVDYYFNINDNFLNETIRIRKIVNQLSDTYEKQYNLLSYQLTNNRNYIEREMTSTSEALKKEIEILLNKYHLLSPYHPFFGISYSRRIQEFSNELESQISNRISQIPVYLIESEKLLNDLHNQNKDLIRYELPHLHELIEDLMSKIPNKQQSLSSILQNCVPNEVILQVKKLQYSSPGFKDLIGAGEVIRQLKELLIYIIDKFCDRNSRRLREKRLEIENDKLRLENERYSIQTKNINNLNDWMSSVIRANEKLSSDQEDRVWRFMESLEKHFAILAKDQKITDVKILEDK